MKPHLLTALLLLVFSGTLCGQSNILNQKIKIESRKGNFNKEINTIEIKTGIIYKSPDLKILTFQFRFLEGFSYEVN